MFKTLAFDFSVIIKGNIFKMNSHIKKLIKETQSKGDLKWSDKTEVYISLLS